MLESGEAEQAVNLQRGLAVLKLPGEDAETIQIPYVTLADLTLFQGAEMPTETGEPGLAAGPKPAADPAAIGNGITPAAVRNYLDAAPDISQNKLADLAEISRSKLSRYINNKAELDPAETERLRCLVLPDIPTETQNVIMLKQYQKA